jgi:hypothetical protein
MRVSNVGTVLLALMLIVSPARMQAKDLLLTGHVTSADGTPLKLARVQLEGMGIGGLTDAYGKYALVVSARRVRGQSAILTARLIGFASARTEVVLTGATIGRDFVLERNPLRLIAVPAMPLPPYVTTASDFLTRHMAAARAAGLRDLRRDHTAGVRELRIWSRGSRLDEIIVVRSDADSAVGAEYEYWERDNSPIREARLMEQWFRSSNCTRRTNGRILTCRRSMSGAADWDWAWNELDLSGIWDLPAEPMDTPVVVEDFAALVVVELWDGRAYRTWSYAVPTSADTKTWEHLSERMKALDLVRRRVPLWSQQ